MIQENVCVNLSSLEFFSISFSMKTLSHTHNTCESYSGEEEELDITCLVVTQW